MDDVQPGARPQASAVWLPPKSPLRRAGSWCPVKTAEGQAEIRQRHRRLTQRQRTLLLLVDGRRSAEQVKALASQAGATDTAFDELLDLGLIAAPPPETPVSQAPDAGPVLDSIPEPATEATAPDATPHVTAAPSVDVARPAAPTDEEFGAAMDAADTGGAIDSGPASDADVFEQFELDAERLPEESARTTTRRVDAVVSSIMPFIESALGGLGPGDAPITSDNALEEARRILVRELRSKAPLTGSFALAKLRRARTREDLEALLDEVESHISKPMRHLSARQTLQHVRGLLTGIGTDETDETDSPA